MVHPLVGGWLGGPPRGARGRRREHRAGLNAWGLPGPATDRPWGGTRAGGLLATSFPLTLALSLGRGNAPGHVGLRARDRASCRRRDPSEDATTTHSEWQAEPRSNDRPLPRGRGLGEGEQRARSPERHRHAVGWVRAAPAARHHQPGDALQTRLGLPAANEPSVVPAAGTCGSHRPAPAPSPDRRSARQTVLRRRWSRRD